MNWDQERRIVNLNRNSDLYGVLSAGRRNVIRLAKRLRKVDSTAYVHRTARVSPGLVAEEWVFIGPRVSLDPMVRIGRYTMLAGDVVVVGDDHVFDRVGVPMQFAGRPTQQGTLIGRDVWVGQGALVRRGVTIGDGAIIAARAVVTRDVQPYEVVAGIPAKHLSWRFERPEDRETHDAMLQRPVVDRSVAPPLETEASD